jgi:hypothetical protein
VRQIVADSRILANLRQVTLTVGRKLTIEGIIPDTDVVPEQNALQRIPMARFCILITAFAALMGSLAQAQDAVSRQPGYWYEGRHLGYVPGHQRQAAQAHQPTAPRRATNVPPLRREVEPASYYEPEAIETVVESPVTSYQIDSSWEGSASCCPTFCCPPSFYLRAELLGWWLDDMDMPPLVTTSPIGTQPNVAGVLGQGGTRVLFGGDEIDPSAHLGGRFTIGRWLDSCECMALEASYFFVGENGSQFSANGFTNPILARPFLSTQTNTQAARLVAYPGLLSGSIDVNTSSDMQGFDALYRIRTCASPCSNLSLLVGYRYLNLNEGLRINQMSRFEVAQGPIVAGTEQRLFDDFSTENHFHGAQLGFTYVVQRCNWTLETQMKFALGGSHSEVTIDGRTRTTVPGGGSAVFAGGLLAQETNMGRYTRDELAFVPELTLNLRWDLACNMQFIVGYNLLYWTSVARPGDQIDFALSQFPPEPPTGAGRPRFNFDTDGVLLHGLQLGLELAF